MESKAHVSSENQGEYRKESKNEDAFSSSSSDHSSDDDDDSSFQTSSSGSSNYFDSSNKKKYTSEFDRAVMKGSTNKGNYKQGLPPLPPNTNNTAKAVNFPPQQQQSPYPTMPDTKTSADEDPLGSGVLPDVLMTMRQKIESMTLFDSDMMQLVNQDNGDLNDPIQQETRESLKRSSQQSISAAVLVSLAHKRYERRRLAAMEIEKVVRSLVLQQELDRVRAILLLLSDDYVRSTSEDARKGGIVALAASAIGLKKASSSNAIAQECRDLILASVVHACQDHSQRVRYYATESLFNVVKVIPSLAVQHFFILFEILRSLYADVDVDVKSGAELLDKKLKEVIVGAMNSGQFTADACVPVFARFVYMRNKATKRLTLTWLQELAEKLIGSPILEFLHLFLGGIFDMVADPTLAIRQSALAFLQSVLPKLLVVKQNHDEAIDDWSIKVDFDKILQSLVTTMEHPDPFVRKVAMYWISRIVKAHIGGDQEIMARDSEDIPAEGDEQGKETEENGTENDSDPQNDSFSSPSMSAATISVRNSLPHVLPGILLSIGDTFHTKAATKDSFLPDQTTHALAEQTNTCLQHAVRRDGKVYVQHLDSFIVALREELDSPGGLVGKNAPAMERKPYRMDVKQDGTGIESQGWFRSSEDTKENDENSMVMSRLCALHWIIVLYESVVPDVLKADYAQEFVIPIIHQFVDNPPDRIIFKSLVVLAKITIPVPGELTASSSQKWSVVPSNKDNEEADLFPMTDNSVNFALGLLQGSAERKNILLSRDREVFRALIELHANNLMLVVGFSRVIAYMCRLQPPEFVFLSFAVELEILCLRSIQELPKHILSRDLQFVSSVIQQMCHALLNSKEALPLRNTLKNCIGTTTGSPRDQKRARLFHILLHAFSHNLVASTSLCLWGGAFRTSTEFLKKVNPLDIHLMFLMELDKLVEMMERPLFRHLHIRMLDSSGKDPMDEGSGTMLFQTMRSLLMCIPQSTCYNILRDRLISTSRFRQSFLGGDTAVDQNALALPSQTELFVNRVLSVRTLHCNALWETIRAESLEEKLHFAVEGEFKLPSPRESGADRREWLGYESKEEELATKKNFKDKKSFKIEELDPAYKDLQTVSSQDSIAVKELLPNNVNENDNVIETEEASWKEHWAQDNHDD